MTYLILLRGINVAGKNKMVMHDFVLQLSNLVEFTKVKSYIQSGNFVITSNLENAELVSLKIKEFILQTYKYKVEVFAYTLKEFISIAQKHPFEIVKNRNYIAFTNGVFGNLNGLAEKNFGKDKFLFLQKQIHICYATKYSNSELHNRSIETSLKTKATTRNWNTVKQLIALATA